MIKSSRKLVCQRLFSWTVANPAESLFIRGSTSNARIKFQEFQFRKESEQSDENFPVKTMTSCNSVNRRSERRATRDDFDPRLVLRRTKKKEVQPAVGLQRYVRGATADGPRFATVLEQRNLFSAPPRMLYSMTDDLLEIIILRASVKPRYTFETTSAYPLPSIVISEISKPSSGQIHQLLVYFCDCDTCVRFPGTTFRIKYFKSLHHSALDVAKKTPPHSGPNRRHRFNWLEKSNYTRKPETLS